MVTYILYELALFHPIRERYSINILCQANSFIACLD